MNKRHSSHKGGFTLLELTISVGIFVVVFVSMMQIFFLMQGTIARINAQREMVAWLSLITQTISTDLESYAIDTSQSDAKTLALKHISNDNKVFYHISNATAPQTGQVLTRELQPASGQAQQSVFSSPLFYFPDLALRVTPDRNSTLKCSLLPAVTLRLSVRGNQDNNYLSNLSESVQTTFSSKVNPLAYSRDCQSTTP